MANGEVYSVRAARHVAACRACSSSPLSQQQRMTLESFRPKVTKPFFQMLASAISLTGVWTESSLPNSKSARKLQILCTDPPGLQALLEYPQHVQAVASRVTRQVHSRSWWTRHLRLSHNMPEEPTVPHSSSALNAIMTTTPANWTAWNSSK